ncbi:ABC transporter permease [Sphingomonas sp. MMS24-J45]|uniref:ABC transporter permease n=1 Tax=Sphingomonas sp. MMS24-J45 TaxID=3238806 RepID=UPI00384C83AE
MTTFRQAFEQEIARLVRDRLDLALLLLMPAICLSLIGGMLSSGNPHGLGVVVVDQDGTPVSRQIIHAIDAVDAVRVVAVGSNLADAFAQVRQEKAIAVVVLPAGIAAARVASSQPRVEIFYQTAFLSTGATASLRLQAVIAAELAAVAPRLAGLPGAAFVRAPLPGVEVTIFGNPGASLEWYLGLLIGPAFLHLLVGVTSIGSLGKELEQGSLIPWARRVRAPAPVLIGRLLPHIVIGTIWLALWFGWLTLGQGYRFGGSLGLVIIGGAFFFAATAAISTLLVSALGEVSTCLSATVIYAGSALAYSGASLPLNGGMLLVRLWSAALPLTHFVALEFDQTTEVLFSVWLRQASVLLLITLLAGGGAVALLNRRPRRAAA